MVAKKHKNTVQKMQPVQDLRLDEFSRSVGYSPYEAHSQCIEVKKKDMLGAPSIVSSIVAIVHSAQDLQMQALSWSESGRPPYRVQKRKIKTFTLIEVLSKNMCSKIGSEIPLFKICNMAERTENMVKCYAEVKAMLEVDFRFHDLEVYGSTASSSVEFLPKREDGTLIFVIEGRASIDWRDVHSDGSVVQRKEKAGKGSICYIPKGHGLKLGPKENTLVWVCSVREAIPFQPQNTIFPNNIDSHIHNVHNVHNDAHDNSSNANSDSNDNTTHTAFTWDGASGCDALFHQGESTTTSITPQLTPSTTTEALMAATTMAKPSNVADRILDQASNSEIMQAWKEIQRLRQKCLRHGISCDDDDDVPIQADQPDQANQADQE